MKPRLKIMGIGAGIGAAFLLLFWLLGDVAGVMGLRLQDSSFFLGLIFLLFGLLFLVRGGKTAKYVVGSGSAAQHSFNHDIAMQKDSGKSQEEKSVRKAPYICLGACVPNIIVCLITNVPYFFD